MVQTTSRGIDLRAGGDAGVVRMSTTPIVALDVGSEADALSLVSRLDGLCDFYKVGLELFTAEGPAIVAAIRQRGCRVFLDLKLHDIPNTVAGAVRGAKRMRSEERRVGK